MRKIAKTAVFLAIIAALLIYLYQGHDSRLGTLVNPSLGTEITLETISLPLDITNDFLPAKDEDISLGAGAVELVGTNIFILDRLGHFYIYDQGRVVKNVLPDLPMNSDDFARHARFPLDESTLRTHYLCYDKATGYLYASYDTYDVSNDTTRFEISRMQAAGWPANPAAKWELVLHSPSLYSTAYYSGRGAGGKMAISGDTLYVAVGDYNLDRGTNIVAQDDNSFLGKIYSYDLKTQKLTRLSKGIRVPEGLMVDAKGQVWETENGERGGDKLNLIQAGANYGWPSREWGTSYQHYGLNANRTNLIANAVEPVFAWVPSIAPTTILELKDFNPLWDGDFLVGSLKGQSLYRLHMRDNHVIFSEPIWIGHRIRDMVARAGQLIIWTDDGSLVFVSVDQELLRSGRLNKGNEYTEGVLMECTGCHSFAEHDQFEWTPSLYHVYGRPIASSVFANYSNGLKAKSGVWDEASLTAFLLSPSTFAPGTTMPGGLMDPSQIPDVIAALKRNSPSAESEGKLRRMAHYLMRIARSAKHRLLGQPNYLPAGTAVSSSPSPTPTTAAVDPLMRCKMCHSFAEHNPLTTTPTLYHVYDRPIASTDFRKYSSGLKAHQGGVWDEANLTAFLLNPAKFAPGTAMPTLQLSSGEASMIVRALKATGRPANN
jgi:cytochrome c2